MAISESEWNKQMVAALSKATPGSKAAAQGVELLKEINPELTSVRSYLEGQGAKVGWDNSTKQVTATLNGQTVSFSPTANIGGTSLASKSDLDKLFVGAVQQPAQVTAAPVAYTPPSGGGVTPGDVQNAIANSKNVSGAQYSDPQFINQLVQKLSDIYAPSYQAAEARTNRTYDQMEDSLKKRLFARGVGYGNFGESDYSDLRDERQQAIGELSAALNRDIMSQAIPLANLSLAERAQLVNENQWNAEMLANLLNQNRNYDLGVGNLMGTFGGQQTLAARNADRDYQLGLAGLTGYINGMPTLGAQQLSQNERLSLLPYQQMTAAQQANYDLAKQESEWARSADNPAYRAQILNNQIAELQLKNLPERQRLELEQLRKSIAQIGRVAARSQAEIEMDNINLQMAREKLKQMQNGSPVDAVKADLAQMSPEDAYYELIDHARDYIADIGVNEFNALVNAYEKAAKL